MNQGSTGCQPVLFGRLPKSSSNVHREAFLDSAGVVGKLPTATELAACAPQTLCCAPARITLFACAALHRRSRVFAIQLGNKTSANLGWANRLTFVGIGAIAESFCIHHADHS